MTLRIVTVVGARPQFIKAAAISRALAEHNRGNPSSDIEEQIVHTGQHYDEGMSQVFFDELQIPRPWKNLSVGSGSHGQQTGLMMQRLEEVFCEYEPHVLLTFGDTNSTLASALVAAKLHTPIAHIEAGLRSYNRKMPEEVNRVLTDHISTWLFCPSQAAAGNLAKEGITNGVHVSGDVMYDALLFNQQLAAEKSNVLPENCLKPNQYSVATIHRAENTDDKSRLTDITRGIGEIGEPVVLPLHPRTRNCLARHAISLPANVKALEPLSYLDMVCLVANAKIVMTDSGGLQKEAYWLNKPCITIRDETEWSETVECGWNRLTGGNPGELVRAFASFSDQKLPERQELYGDGKASDRIVRCLANAITTAR